ncbi:MAG TPA: DNA helicase PcrA [Bacillota bacterium]|jgi:DNA helicase-2/ATP-dependent DNA helicase PcrA
MEILENLNDAQREAVTYGDGPLLILAGAGSGKTRALTHRIAYLIAERGVRPHEILAITFTNKAAGEMRERVAQLVGPAAADMWVLTFHAACVRILRRDIERLELGYTRRFNIYDHSDQMTVVKNCLKDLNLDERRWAPAAVHAAIDRAKNDLVTWQEFKRRADDFFLEKAAEVYEAYQKKLIENNALDFDDLIMLTVKLFEARPDVLGSYQDRFRYILIDEYQDTNRAQYVLINLLAKKNRNLSVVGDDDQSIYRWRGADLRNILEFEQDYPEVKVVKLEQNYRSTGKILDAANAVVRNNLGRKEKTLWTANPAGEPALFYQAENEYDEAAFVGHEIRRLKAQEGLEDRDFAVLYRMNAQSRALEDSFMKVGLPYRIVGGVRFYERKEIKDLLAYLRLINNPSDSLSFERVVNVPKRGLGDTSLEKLAVLAAEQGLPMFQAAMLAAEGLGDGLSPRARKELGKFVVLLDELGKKREALGLPEFVRAVAEGSGLWGELIAERTTEAQSRMENIQELYTVAADFVERNGDQALETFLESIALITDLDGLDRGAAAVVFMTLHSAKGLEFPVVFLVGLEEGIFPHSRALEDEDELEEERRLCYVGITRARRRIYLTSTFHRNFRGQTVYNTLSRFVQEIPEGLRLNLSQPAAAAGRPPSRGSTWAEAAAAGRRASAGMPARLGTQVAGAQGTGVGGAAPVASLRPGDKVEHPKWGPGTVVTINGNGPSAEITVAFPGVGLKKLVAEYARLRKV